MFHFRIQADSYIPPSQQLVDQIQFAIASRQYQPGQRLPSTRQLAQMTGLHRNTISKVYRHLEEKGLVESITGSGIYVKAQGHEGGTRTPGGAAGEAPRAAEKQLQAEAGPGAQGDLQRVGPAESAAGGHCPDRSLVR